MNKDTMNLNPGVFFPWPDNKKGDTESGITVRQLSVRQRREIDALTTEEEVKYIDGLVYTRKKITDEALRFRLIQDYCIVCWKGKRGPDGREILCTTETKEMLMLDDPRMVQFVAECLMRVDEIRTERAENAEKNS